MLKQNGDFEDGEGGGREEEGRGGEEGRKKGRREGLFGGLGGGRGRGLGRGLGRREEGVGEVFFFWERGGGENTPPTH